VLILAGSNDARDAALWPWDDGVAGAARAISAMAGTAQAASARVVVADLLPPGPQPWWRALLIGDRQGRAMQAITARLALPARTRRLPVARLLAGRDGRIDPAMRSDHLHYSPAGYARLAAGLAPLLQDACADFPKSRPG
jgi:lysophospholipase L1-like esterase